MEFAVLATLAWLPADPSPSTYMDLLSRLVWVQEFSTMNLITEPLSAFNSLPAELLSLILDCQHSATDRYAGDIVDFDTLKSLRLACRQYTYLPRLLSRVFGHIRVEASAEQVRIAESIDFACIKPYVKTITITPSKYSWAMTENEFRNIIMIPRSEEICRDMNYDGTGGEPQIKELGCEAFVKEHSNGEIPFSETEIATAYKQYMLDAEQLRDMFETRQVQRALTRLFVELPTVRSFKIGFWEFDGRNDGSWRTLPCDIRAHTHRHHSPIHKEELCRGFQKPVGDELFKAVIAGCIAAKSNIVQLDIECILDRNFVWADDGTLNELDLSNLRTLSFDPIDVDEDKRHWSAECAATAQIRCGLAISALLQKCSSGLCKLIISPDYTGSFSYLEWPPTIPNKLPSLPALESFITGLRLDLAAFAQFLHQLPALTFLQLNQCGGDLEDWRQLWDAIRDHPNRMMLKFDQLLCNEAAEYSGTHHTGEASSAEFEDDPWDNIAYSLENYLSGRRHWDRTLEMWFGHGDGGPTDSEEEDSDDDNDGYGTDGASSEHIEDD